MSITRKNRFEVFENGETFISQHNDRVESIEAAQSLGPGTHQIKVDGGLYLEVINKGADLKKLTDSIKINAISIKINGVEHDVEIPVEVGDLIEVRYNGVPAGKMTA